MALEHRFACPLPNGLHARPASHLEAVASRFAADATLVNERTGVEANAKSVLALISADIQPGDPLLLRVSGAGAEAAFADLDPLPARRFCRLRRRAAAPRPRARIRPCRARCRRPAPAADPARRRALPRPGGRRGPAGGRIAVHRRHGNNGSPRKAVSGRGRMGAFQRRRSLRVRLGVGEGKRGRQRTAGGNPARPCRAAGGCFLRAKAWRKSWRGRADLPVGHAVLAAVERFSATLRRSTSAYLQERVLDLQDIGARLLGEIYGAGRGPGRAGARPARPSSSRKTSRPANSSRLDRDTLARAGPAPRRLDLAHRHPRALVRPADPRRGGRRRRTWRRAATPFWMPISASCCPEPNEPTRRYYALEQRRHRTRGGPRAARSSADARRQPRRPAGCRCWPT